MLSNGAFVDEQHSAIFNGLDHVLFGGPACGLHHLYALFHTYAYVAGIVWDHQGRHKGEVNGKRLVGLFLYKAYFMPQVLGSGKGGGGYETKTAGLGHGCHQRSSGYPLHTALDYRVFNAQLLG